MLVHNLVVTPYIVSIQIVRQEIELFCPILLGAIFFAYYFELHSCSIKGATWINMYQLHHPINIIQSILHWQNAGMKSDDADASDLTID
jgi:hypothetical protein